MHISLSISFITVFGCVFAVAVPAPQDAQVNNTMMAQAAAASTAAQTADASNPINGLLAGLGMIPIIGESITAISSVLTDFEGTLAKALNVDTTEDGVSGCKDMTVIFARGTTEPGNVGLVTGPPFFDALTAMIGQNSIEVQGVEYPASIEGFLQGGDATGSQTMATMITNTLNSCPNTKVVMSGYSQGGQLVHNAANLLPASTMAKVSSVVIFGDPDFGQAVTGAASTKTKVICHPDDNICQHGDLILLAHLTYSTNAQEAATFAATAAGMALGN